MKKLFLIISAILGISTIGYAANEDPEIFDKVNKDIKPYINIMPPGVKTIACISPGSYPGSKLHRQGIEILRKAGYKVKVMPQNFLLKQI